MKAKKMLVILILVLVLVFVGSAIAGWVTSGNNMHSDVSGNVGIGTKDMTGAKLSIDASSVSTADYARGIRITKPNLGNSKSLQINIGKEDKAGKTAEIRYYHAGDNSDDNALGLGFFGQAKILNVTHRGNVGIGTTKPKGKLHVDGGTAVSGNGANVILKAQDTKQVNKNGGNIILRPGKCSEHFDNEGKPGKVEVHGELYVYGSDGFNAVNERATVYLGGPHNYISSVYGFGVRIGTYGVGDAITLSQLSGNVGIGTKTPTQKLSVNGNVRINKPPTWDEDNDFDLTWNMDTGVISKEGSSRRYKQNICPFQEDFRDILKLEAKQYEMREGYGKPGQQLFGYIAEELEEVGLTKLVTHDAEGRPDGIKYKKIAIYLNEVVKEHERDIAELKSEFSKLQALKKENTDLHDRIKTLESLVGRLTTERSSLRNDMRR
jgi:hypothetical protein